jgi:menaquinone-dependent protoporphyrinogen oxidase
MKTYLIVYGTKEGQTAKIAQFMGNIIDEHGHKADLYDAKSVPEHLSLDKYNGILVGSSVHIGYWSQAIRNFAQKYHTRLDNIPSAFFSVSMSAASPDTSATERLDHQVEKFLDKTGWHPRTTVHFAGCVAYTKYGFLTKMMMKAISKSQHESTNTSEDHVYTNWDKVKEFVNGFIEEDEVADQSTPEST